VRREPVDHAEHFAHRRRSADHPAHLEPLGQVGVAGHHRVANEVLLPHRSHQRADAREIERLGEVFRGAELDRLHRVFDAGVAAHQGNLRARPRRAHRAQHVEAVDARHVEVEQNEVDVAALQHLDGGAAVCGLEHLELLALPDLVQQLSDLRIVVY
jgi:hypothetical protein